jgi:hypothetical protein
MRICLLSCWAVCAWAQSGIEVPTLGAVVDASGGLRPVHGVAGNFLLGPATVPGVLSAACSGQLCLAKTDSKILSPTGETGAPAGPAVFGVNAGEALLFFPETRTFARWRGDALETLDWTIEGEILSVRLRGGEAEIAVRRDADVWIIHTDGHPDGSVIDWIAATPGPVLLLGEGVVFAASDQLVLRRPDASELRFDLPGAESIAAMGPHYVAIRAEGATYALRTEPGRETLLLLPGSTSGSTP